VQIQLLALIAVVIPVVMSLAGIHRPAFPSRKRALALIALGLVCSGVLALQQCIAGRSHEGEITAARQANETLTRMIQSNQIENAATLGYVRGRLQESEDLNLQYAPAIKRLAEVSAEYTRKQYEARILSDQQLHSLIMDVVKRINDYSVRYDSWSAQSMLNEMDASSRGTLTDSDRHQLWLHDVRRIEFSHTKENGFRFDILPVARYARQELLARHITEPTMSPLEKSEVESVLQGSLAGVHPEYALASYLDLMARQLSHK